MFRKIALITITIVLGLAVFTGCSNDAVTPIESGKAFTRNGDLEGVVYIDGEPVGENEAGVILWDNSTLPYKEICSDTTNIDGEYALSAPAGIYAGSCGITSGEHNTQWEERIVIVDGLATVKDWYFYTK